MTITLYGWGAMFELPSPSSFVMKSDIHLQMFGRPFERAIADLESVGKHKAPYVRDNGVLIEDSAFIRRHFEKKLGVDLDHGLSAAQRGAALALEAMLEGRFQQFGMIDRWLDDANFNKGPRQFFMRVPEPAREAVIAEVRGNLAKTMHDVGVTRYTREERREIARGIVEATSAMLGDKRYFFGDEPTGVDGAAFGGLAFAATRYFDGDLPAIIEERANLADYLARMRKEFFGEDRWPKMG